MVANGLTEVAVPAALSAAVRRPITAVEAHPPIMAAVVTPTMAEVEAEGAGTRPQVAMADTAKPFSIPTLRSAVQFGRRFYVRAEDWRT
jgi:hypothetical protein